MHKQVTHFSRSITRGSYDQGEYVIAVVLGDGVAMFNKSTSPRRLKLLIARLSSC